MTLTTQSIAHNEECYWDRSNRIVLTYWWIKKEPITMTDKSLNQSMLGFFPSSAHSFHKIGLIEVLTTWEIASSNLCVDLNTRIRWYEMVYERRELSSMGSVAIWWEHSPGISYRFHIGIPLLTIASYFMSLIETILSTFLIPNQWRTSGMRAWKRISLTPAMISVDLKYLSAESPPRLRRL